MDILNQLTNEIEKLSLGEKRNITAQELFLSRNDFQSISAYLTREAEKGHFSISKHSETTSHLAPTSLTVIKH